MNFNQILTDLNNKLYHPVYFLMGEESYYIDEISNYIEKNVLDETEKEFNQSILYGKDVKIPDIVSYAKRYPMMSNYHVVIVKEAQNIKKIEDLQSYLENLLSSTILVICYKYKKLDKRKAIAKLIAKKGVLFETPRIYDNQVAGWITDYLKKRKHSISPKASALIAENLGTNLGKIVNELEKLLINLPANSEITPEHIEKNIGISKDFNVFELQSALTKKNIYKANQIINYFSSNLKENPIQKILVNLYSYFSKVLVYHFLSDKSNQSAASALSVNPFFLNDYKAAARNYSKEKLFTIMSDLRKYDLKSKGVDNTSTNGGELMKELVFKILH